MAARGCICTGDSSGIVRTNDLARTVSYWCHPIARAVDAFRTTPTDSAWGVPLSVGRCVRDMLKHRTSIGTNILFVKLMVFIYIYIYMHTYTRFFTYLQNWMNHQVVCPICDCTGLHALGSNDLLPQFCRPCSKACFPTGMIETKWKDLQNHRHKARLHFCYTPHTPPIHK